VPSSYLAYGIDGNGDGVVDLFDFSDAMASTANFLKSHGWHSKNAKRQFRAILAYNHCENYAKAVLTYSKQVRLSHNKKPNTTKINNRHQNRQKGKDFVRI
jgi:membrane-bound lytic murein transglycosylase B